MPLKNEIGNIYGYLTVISRAENDKNDLLCLIEYNGKQHYEPVDFFGGVDAFIDQQKRDNLKREFCKNKRILLFTIKYDENIQERLEENLDELYG